MVKLFCVSVEEVGGVFPVDIDAGQSVGDLKDVIAAKLKFTGRADQLQLFLAKKDSAWLLEKDPAAQALDDGEIHPVVKKMIDENKMMSSWTIEDVLKDFKMTGVHAPSSKQVHVLVVLPSDKKRKRDAAVDGETAQDKKTINFDEFLENCPEKGSLPTEGDFLQLFEWNYQNCGEVKDIEAIGNIVGFTGSKFFVRKEVVCVLENLKIFKGIFDSGVFSKQFVLLGSPGTGKSCVLALLCFYVAVTTDQPVLWFRTVSGGRGERATRLFYKKKYYQWDGDDGEIYDCVYDEIKSRTKGFFWPCLDGFNQESLSSSHSRRVVDFTLLATSGQFDVKSEGFSLVTLCLMPYWNRADLKLLARAFEEPTEEDIANRYFASGGCLREFLNPDAREILQFALDKITTPEHARSLLTARGCTSNEQIDRLRMRGVADVSNPTYYVKPSKWKAVVNSLFVLRHLTSLMEPNFFEELIGLARGMKDDRLEGVALEGYFHALVRRGQPISIDYCTYDNVDRTIMNKKEWRTIMDKDKGSISCAPANKVKWSGDSIEHCVRIMEEWAVDLSIADYWIPADSLCETIDAVAKCKFPGEKDSRICFLQLTKAQKHKCDADILWRLAQPFVGNAKVCYIALLSLPDKEIRSDFRLKPAVISNPEVLEHIPLYVASYRLGSIESTSS